MGEWVRLKKHSYFCDPNENRLDGGVNRLFL